MDIDIISKSREVIINKIKQLKLSQFILIIDNFIFNLINGILNKFELYRIGCVDIDFITNERERIDKIDVVYFLQPNETNIDLLNKDFNYIISPKPNRNFIDKVLYFGLKEIKQEYCLYDKIHVLFSERITVEKINEIRSNQLLNSRIKSLNSLEFNYIPWNKQIFTLQYPKPVYEYQLNDFQFIFSQLFNFCIFHKILPTIYYHKDHQISTFLRTLIDQLTTYYKEHLLMSSIQYACLVIMSRNLDYFTPNLHFNDYFSIVSDVLNLGESKEIYLTEPYNGNNLIAIEQLGNYIYSSKTLEEVYNELNEYLAKSTVNGSILDIKNKQQISLNLHLCEVIHKKLDQIMYYQVRKYEEKIKDNNLKPNEIENIINNHQKFNWIDLLRLYILCYNNKIAFTLPTLYMNLLPNIKSFTSLIYLQYVTFFDTMNDILINNNESFTKIQPEVIPNDYCHTLYIPFIIGGITFHELNSLISLERLHNIQIIIGCSNIFTPTQFAEIYSQYNHNDVMEIVNHID